MFPCSSLSGIICPENEDNKCTRPNCNFFHSDRRPYASVFTNRKAHSWLEPNSPMINLVRGNLCPPPRSTVRVVDSDGRLGLKVEDRPSTASPSSSVEILSPTASASASASMLTTAAARQEKAFAQQSCVPILAKPVYSAATLFSSGRTSPIAPQSSNVASMASLSQPVSYLPDTLCSSSTYTTHPANIPLMTMPSGYHATNPIFSVSPTLASPLRLHSASAPSLQSLSESRSYPPSQKVIKQEADDDIQFLAVVKKEIESAEADTTSRKRKKALDLPLPVAVGARAPVLEDDMLDDLLRQEQLKLQQEREKKEKMEKLQKMIQERKRLEEENRQSYANNQAMIAESLRVPSPATTALSSTSESEGVGLAIASTSPIEINRPPKIAAVVKHEIDTDHEGPRLKKKPALEELEEDEEMFPSSPEAPRRIKKKPAIEDDVVDDIEMEADVSFSPPPMEYVPTPLAELERQKKERKEKEAAKKRKDAEEALIRKKEKQALKRRQKEEEERKERKRKEKEKAKKLEDKNQREKERLARQFEEKKRKVHIKPIDDLFDAETDSDVEPSAPKKLKGNRVITSTERSSTDSSKNKPSKKSSDKGKSLTHDQLVAAKQRVAHTVSADRQKPSSSSAMTTSKKMTPQQQLALRIEQRERDLEKQKKESNTAAVKRSVSNDDSRMRTGTISKGESRVAHVKLSSSTVKPKVLDVAGSKISSVIRHRTIEKLFDAHRAVAGSDQEAADCAAAEELKIAKSSSMQSAYISKMAALLKTLKDAASGGSGSGKVSVSHMANLCGPKAADFSVGVNRAKKAMAGGGIQSEEGLYDELLKYLITPEQMRQNCYPKWRDEEKFEVEIAESEWDKGRGRDKRFIDDSDLSRKCSRCSKEFRLNKDGEVVKGDCCYHPLRMTKKKENKAFVSRYACCDGPLDAPGCAASSSHVTESVRWSELLRFRDLPLPASKNDVRSKRVFALDCEMVYTVWGPALARISVVDMNDELVYDVKIKPEHTVVDANTRFSGLTIEELEREGRSWDEAQRGLDQLCNRETILIGHSLESDLKAMRIVHEKVVDTSLIFPHRLGPPLKRALRDLASQYLHKIIQEEVSGHDSKEDASACMQLMLMKVRGAI